MILKILRTRLTKLSSNIISLPFFKTDSSNCSSEAKALPIVNLHNNYHRELFFVLIIVGIGLRAFHYLRQPAVWFDEAALILNILQQSLEGLAHSLTHHQAAPPFFLWLEKCCLWIFGESTLSLRLIPFLASVLGFLLFCQIASKLLDKTSSLWAIALIACSDHLLWHTCEVKPYTIDTLVATLSIWLYLKLIDRSLFRQSMVWFLIWPIAIWLSYPSCFICSGILLVLAWNILALRENRSKRNIFGLGLVTLGLAVSFYLLLTGPIHGQKDLELDRYWDKCFPNWSNIWTVPPWAFLSTLEMFRYLHYPLGATLIPFALVGIYRFWRSQKPLTIVLLCPWLTAFFASLIRNYPYGGIRLLVFLTPAATLFIAEGTAPIFSWCRQKSKGFFILALFCLCFPLGYTGYRLVAIWPRYACDDISSWVLPQLKEGDRILINHWEYEYYFRGQPWENFNPPIVPIFPPSKRERVWLVINANNQERAMFLQLLKPKWQIIDEFQIDEASATLLQFIPDSK